MNLKNSNSSSRKHSLPYMPDRTEMCMAKKSVPGTCRRAVWQSGRRQRRREGRPGGMDVRMALSLKPQAKAALRRLPQNKRGKS